MSRIINRQRQLAEQGRLRLGYTVPATTRDGRDTMRPVRSETWIVTSHSREHVEHAANLWGGTVEEWEPMGNGAKQWRVITQARAIAAILPPGDPLTQAYEQWNRGGCVRRCDGVTEELSGSPCICLAQHGEGWYELSAREVCGSKSRLKVLLPDMPGLGSWRMETGSFYATDEIAGMVDTIRGAVGENVLVPVTLRIEPRTRVAGGETKQFVVPVLELRGVTAGALLSGQAIETRTLSAGDPGSATPLAIQATNPVPDGDRFAPHFASLAACGSIDEMSSLWKSMAHEGLVGSKAQATPRAKEFVAAFKARAEQLQAPAESSAPVANPDGTYDAEVVETPPAAAGDDAAAAAVWQQILGFHGSNTGLPLNKVVEDFKDVMGGLDPGVASAAELQSYLAQITTGEAVPA